jgi:(p)ppGpp synthase/HD superfamily hydrolase
MIHICEGAKWCIQQHISTNHLYDNYLPYEYHLRSVVEIFNEFENLLPFDLREPCRVACWGHDVIEDTRNTYNDVKKELGEKVANIIYALTNEKGKNRSERANDKYYQGIRNEPGAVFIKLCDRIANVKYGIKTGSRMVEMYKKENEKFIEKLNPAAELKPIVDYLDTLLKRSNFKLYLVE